MNTHLLDAGIPGGSAQLVVDLHPLASQSARSVGIAIAIVPTARFVARNWSTGPDRPQGKILSMPWNDGG